MYESFLKSFDEVFKYEESLKIAKLSNEDVIKFKEKVKNNKNVPQNYPDRWFLMFLYFESNDLERAALRIENYFKCKRDGPEFFKNRDLQLEELQGQLDTVNFVMLPKLSDTTGLILLSLAKFDAKDYDADISAKILSMFTEAYLCMEGVFEIVVIMDLKGSSFNHMLRVHMKSVKKGIQFFNLGNPIKPVKFHILNTKPFIYKILKMFKKLLPKELLDTISFHTGDLDWEEFYRDHIPKSHLPSNYGGDLENVETLNKKTYEKMLSLENYFKAEEEIVYGKLGD